HLRRYVAFLASWLVACPLLGQRQAEVEQDMVVVRDVAHEHADLAVVNLAPVATPLALDAHRVRAAFGETAGIESDDAIGLAHAIGHLTNQHLEQRSMLPWGGTDEGSRSATKNSRFVLTLCGGISCGQDTAPPLPTGPGGSTPTQSPGVYWGAGGAGGKH